MSSVKQQKALKIYQRPENNQMFTVLINKALWLWSDTPFSVEFILANKES